MDRKVEQMEKTKSDDFTNQCGPTILVDDDDIKPHRESDVELGPMITVTDGTVEPASTVSADEAVEATSNTKASQRRVLLPIDGSDNSKRAYKWYFQEMKRDNDEVIFIEIICPLASHTFNGFSFTLLKEELENLSGVTQERVEKAKKLAKRFKARAIFHGAKNAKAYIHIHQCAGEALIEAIAKYNIDMVVMGSRGLGKLRRTFLGSVSDYVLHHAEIPVTIVPPGPGKTDSLTGKKPHQSSQSAH